MPTTLTISVLKRVTRGNSTPFRTHFTSLMPLPAATGSIHAVGMAAHATYPNDTAASPVTARPKGSEPPFSISIMDSSAMMRNRASWLVM